MEFTGLNQELREYDPVKVMFIENRYKTYFWDKVAGRMLDDGIDVAWIVQNHAFYPQSKRVHVIPYPKGADLSRVVPNELKEMESRDRNINFFGGNTGHYAYYHEQIEHVIKEEMPDVIIGEATLFHELITIAVAKSMGIPYFHPSSCRLPPGRFCFYREDTMEPFGGSREVSSVETALQFAKQQASGAVKIDYMVKPSKKKAYINKLKKIRGWYAVFAARMHGEIYNTPSLATKLSLAVRHHHVKAEWEKICRERQVLPERNYILYPLQMQPECNIDVWGNSYRNQTQVVSDILEQLPDGWGLLLKPNPKSKYELSPELIGFVKKHENIIPLSHSSAMVDALKLVQAVITVSGTISLESIFTGFPCLSLAMPYVRDSMPQRHLSSVVELKAKLMALLGLPDADVVRDQAVSLYRYQIYSSYQGLISDPFSDVRCIDPVNIEKIYASIKSLFVDSRG